MDVVIVSEELFAVRLEEWESVVGVEVFELEQRPPAPIGHEGIGRCGQKLLNHVARAIVARVDHRPLLRCVRHSVLLEASVTRVLSDRQLIGVARLVVRAARSAGDGGEATSTGGEARRAGDGGEARRDGGEARRDGGSPAVAKR